MDCKNNPIQKILWELNKELDLPASYLGTHYLVYASVLVAEDQQRLTMVTKWLYPEVAARYRTSWQAVERNIRTVIALCWARDAGEQLGQAIGCTFSAKPSPSGLIQQVARYLMEQSQDVFPAEILGDVLGMLPV